MGRGDLAGAAAVYATLVAEDCEDSYAAMMLAQCHEWDGRLGAAAPAAEEAVRRAPENLDALQVAARIAVAAKQYDRAEEHVRRALALPEVRTEMPDQLPRWFRRAIGLLPRLPGLRHRIDPEEVSREIDPGHRAARLRDWKRWALGYLAWRRGEPPSDDEDTVQ